MKMVVSSAKGTVESGRRPSEKSLMKEAKRVGPSTDPCGTPDIGTYLAMIGEDHSLGIQIVYLIVGDITPNQPAVLKYYPVTLIQCKMCEQGCLAQGHFESGEPHFAPFTLYKWGKPLFALSHGHYKVGLTP